MGSEKYPFKGFLDVIANRCFASGTNAWTDQDHTAYTMDTVRGLGNVDYRYFYVIASEEGPKTITGDPMIPRLWRSNLTIHLVK